MINKSKPIPSLELQISPFDFNNIPAVFEENIPEGINREILETTSRTADEFQILTMLEDNIGDLSFTKTREIVVKFQIMFPPVSHLCFHFFKQVLRV